jgi:hypothetical protein
MCDADHVLESGRGVSVLGNVMPTKLIETLLFSSGANIPPSRILSLSKSISNSTLESNIRCSFHISFLFGALYVWNRSRISGFSLCVTLSTYLSIVLSVGSYSRFW